MSEYVHEQIDSYYTYKWWLHIIFDTDTKNYLRTPHITFDISVLKNLEIIVEKFSENGYFDNQIKNNIHTLLAHAREYKDDFYKERVKLINDITSLLNAQVVDNSFEFYRYQLYTRTKDIRYILYNDQFISYNVNYAKQLIYDDFTIITTHQKDTTEKQFNEEYLAKFRNEQIYYENIAMLLEECPYLFLDETFYNRVMKVLNENKKIEKFQKFNNKTINKINRKVKKIKL